MDQEKLTIFLCPWCGKDDVVCYKKRISGKLKPRFEFSYLGLCCEYYPHDNPCVESAIRKMHITRLNLPKAYGMGEAERVRDEKRIAGTLRHFHKRREKSATKQKFLSRNKVLLNIEGLKC